MKWIDGKIMALNDWLWPSFLEPVSFLLTGALIGWAIAAVIAVVSALA